MVTELAPKCLPVEEQIARIRKDYKLPRLTVTNNTLEIIARLVVAIDKLPHMLSPGEKRALLVTGYYTRADDYPDNYCPSVEEVGKTLGVNEEKVWDYFKSTVDSKTLGPILENLSNAGKTYHLNGDLRGIDARVFEIVKNNPLLGVKELTSRLRVNKTNFAKLETIIRSLKRIKEHLDCHGQNYDDLPILNSTTSPSFTI
ncbi:MAG: hypothetical protein ABH816_04085 [Candidatus Levyibacteriota bacterium]